MANIIKFGMTRGAKVIEVTPETSSAVSPIRFLNISGGQNIAEKKLKATLMVDGVKTIEPAITTYVSNREDGDNITGIYLPNKGSILYSPPLKIVAGTTVTFGATVLRPSGSYLNSHLIGGIYQEKDVKKDVPFTQPNFPWTEENTGTPQNALIDGNNDPGWKFNGTEYVTSVSAGIGVTADEDGNTDIIRLYIQAWHQMYVSSFYAYAQVT